MPVTMEWLVTNRVVIIVLKGTMSLDEIRQMDSDLNTMLEEGYAKSGSPVHMVVQGRELINISHPLDAVKMSTIQHNQAFGIMIVSGISNPIVNFVGKLYGSITGKKVMMAASMDAALETLKKQDSSLTNLAEAYKIFRQ